MKSKWIDVVACITIAALLVWGMWLGRYACGWKGDTPCRWVKE